MLKANKATKAHQDSTVRTVIKDRQACKVLKVLKVRRAFKAFRVCRVLLGLTVKMAIKALLVLKVQPVRQVRPSLSVQRLLRSVRRGTTVRYRQRSPDRQESC